MNEPNFKTKLRRVMKAGFLISGEVVFVFFGINFGYGYNFVRHWLCYFVGAILNITMGELRNKVDINVYFVTTATENDILSQRKNRNFTEVKTIEYTSREKALENFKLVLKTTKLFCRLLKNWEIITGSIFKYKKPKSRPSMKALPIF